MIKYDVLNRVTGKVQFTAKIDCGGSAPRSLKLKLAVLWAIENSADLSNADLSGADLCNVDLRWASLRGVDLIDAKLSQANLSGVDLRGANLRFANLRLANLSNTNLRDVNLSEADFRGANLSGANLRVLQGDLYTCYIQKDWLQVGCELHSFDGWLSFDDKQIIAMDGKRALEWWRVWKPIILSIRETME